jgi:Fic family protein
MVNIEKKVGAKHTYYYLEHSIRRGRRVKKKTLYLGKQIPTNIDKIKKNFLIEIYKIQFFESLTKIKQKYSREQKHMSQSLKEKNIKHFTTTFTYNTQKIEGSKLSLHETAALLEEGTLPKNRTMRDVNEAQAHKILFHKVLTYDKELTLNTILEWHKLLFQDTRSDIAGKIRKHRVGISGSKFVPPLPVEIYPLLRDFFKWYTREKEKIHPVQLSALVHLKFVTIHPFDDGNGRISRVMMNFVLNRKNYPLLNIPYVGRNSYYKALERSQTKKEDDFFVQWLMRNYIKIYKFYL